MLDNLWDEFQQTISQQIQLHTWLHHKRNISHSGHLPGPLFDNLLNGIFLIKTSENIPARQNRFVSSFSSAYQTYLDWMTEALKVTHASPASGALQMT